MQTFFEGCHVTLHGIIKCPQCVDDYLYVWKDHDGKVVWMDCWNCAYQKNLMKGKTHAKTT